MNRWLSVSLLTSSRVIGIILASSILAGCGTFGMKGLTALRCGTSDGDSSYVDLVNLPEELGQNTRYFAQLCGFLFERQEDE